MVLKEDPKEGIISAKCRSSGLLILVELKALAVFSFLGVRAAEVLVSCLSILTSMAEVAATDTTGLDQGESPFLTIAWTSFGPSDILVCFSLDRENMEVWFLVVMASGFWCTAAVDFSN